MENNPLDVVETVAQISDLKTRYPGNIGLQCFDATYFNALEPGLQTRLLACIRSGVENPQSEVGCYANFCDDYESLDPYFSSVVARYHKVTLQSHQESDWNLPSNANNPSSVPLDLSQLGLPALSTRVRVARNLSNFALPAAMSVADRLGLENEMVGIFRQLSSRVGFEGNYHSLTPDYPNRIDADQYQQLVMDHLMFKSMEHDPFLTSAGISSNWPHGRGCYLSNNRDFIVWVGEEDHLRIMVMDTTTDLSGVFGHLKSALDIIEQLGPSFAFSEKFGTITSCPTNLGTGMRASVHLKLPKLTTRYTEPELNEIARNLGLSIRGLGGEHTPYGADGTIDVSPRARFGITEAAIVTTLYEGIDSLTKLESDL